MNLKQSFLTENECYIEHKKHEVKGLMLHSTGANNPYLKRYIFPNDGLIGTPSSNHWNTFRPSNKQVCVHGFIGKLQDETVATYQTLPWDIVGWHSGSGSLGYSKNANNTGYIGVEICEDDLKDGLYFEQVYKEAVELFAYLCNLYSLDPIADIICHSEGYRLGIASNHADVMHWFPKFGKSMDTFRQDVNKELIKLQTKKLYRVQVGVFGNVNNANLLVSELKTKGYAAIVKQDSNEVINTSLIAKQIREELQNEYDEKYNKLKENILRVLESEG